MINLTGDAAKSLPRREIARISLLTVEREPAEEEAVPGLWAQFLAWLDTWRRVRRDEAMLQKQPDYMLRDIGLGRSEIECAVRGQSRWRGAIGPRV